MAPKGSSIKDVARAAGVSTATVSRALSNPDLLTDSTRAAVFEAIRATGYRVNAAARNLRTKRAGAVLVLVPNLGNHFFSQILAGIGETMRAADYSVLITDTAGVTDKGQAVANYFLDGRIDGLITLDGAMQGADLTLFREVNAADRIVFACEWVQGAPQPVVCSDNDAGARLAVRHLHALGHRKIAHVTGPAGNVLTRVRREGMLAERERLGLPARPEWIIRGDFSLRSGAEAAQRILAMRDRPTAVFCASDMVAFGLISTLTQAGVRVPQDISVVGFDDIEMSAYYVPALTTVRQDRPSLGRAAAETLLALLDARTPPPPSRVLDVELIVRGSTAPAMKS